MLGATFSIKFPCFTSAIFMLVVSLLLSNLLHWDHQKNHAGSISKQLAQLHFKEATPTAAGISSPFIAEQVSKKNAGISCLSEQDQHICAGLEPTPLMDCRDWPGCVSWFSTKANSMNRIFCNQGIVKRWEDQRRPSYLMQKTACSVRAHQKDSSADRA